VRRFACALLRSSATPKNKTKNKKIRKQEKQRKTKKNQKKEKQIKIF